MYKSISIENFRKITKLDISGLSRINLIAGKNNVGKTTFLESIFLLNGAYSPDLTLKINAFRGMMSIKMDLTKLKETPWDNIFHEFNNMKKIKISGKNGGKYSRTITLKIVKDLEELAKIDYPLRYIPVKGEEKETISLATENVKVLELGCKEKNKALRKNYMINDASGLHVLSIPPTPLTQTIFVLGRNLFPISVEADRFGKLEILGLEQGIVEALKVIEPRLQRLTVIPQGKVAMIYGDIGKSRLVPLPLMGDGNVHLLSILLAIADARGGIVLIDEVDTGIHYSVMAEVWKVIAKAAREFDVQIFATTHSHECIENAYEAFREKYSKEFCMYRLEEDKEEVRAIRIDHKTLGIALKKGLEIR